MKTFQRPAPASRSAQAGLTLIEFMISIVLGMIVVAAMAVLIANQSVSRSEVDRAGRLIENGRYAIGTLAEDLQMAGYWGQSTTAPTTTQVTDLTGGLPDPCTSTLVGTVPASPGIQESSMLYVQGYDGSSYTSGTLGCLSNWKSGTDIIVIRHADPDTSAITTTSATPYNCSSSTVTSATGLDLTKLGSTGGGALFLQTGLTDCSTTSMNAKLARQSSGSDSTTFTLTDKDGIRQRPEKWLVHIYYVATCDVCSGTPDGIPTLKRVELSVSSGSLSMTCSTCTATIAEGVENLQIEYGVDSGSPADGSPDSYIAADDASLTASPPTNWTSVVSAKVWLVARSTEKSPNYTDSRTYCLKSACATSSDYYTPASADQAYQRHLFLQSVRLANPTIRRSS